MCALPEISVPPSFWVFLDLPLSVVATTDKHVVPYTSVEGQFLFHNS